VSEVYSTFANNLPTAIMKMISIKQEERAYMLKLNQHRFDFMYRNAHGLGYLQDSQYVGERMSIELRSKIENIIYLHPSAAEELSTTFSEKLMYKEYTDFPIAALELKSADPSSLAYRMIKERKTSVLKFWLSRGDQWPVFCRPDQCSRNGNVDDNSCSISE
jgi:hypothetical protein